MKKTLFLTMLLALVSLSTMAMSRSKVRNHARYLTDRMAYELDFTPMQYDDCYEINYDFIYSVRNIMDDVVYGYYDAINLYYRYLDYRNEDLRYIMTASQYIRFMTKDYFYRPIYTSGSSWNFRIYTIYSNRSFFYYDAPSIFKSYRGGHSRSYFSTGFYNNRYMGHDHYKGSGVIVGSRDFNNHRRSDFGTNLRERNQKPDYNNYGNRNSSNRTADPRYRDNSGNRNAPLINNRTTSSGEHRGQSTTSRMQTSTSRTQTNTSSQARPQASTQTSSRTGNTTATPTTSTRGETRGNRTNTTRR